MLPSIALDGLNSCNEFINITYETAVQMERIGIYPRGGGGGKKKEKTKKKKGEGVLKENQKPMRQAGRGGRTTAKTEQD